MIDDPFTFDGDRPLAPGTAPAPDTTDRPLDVDLASSSTFSSDGPLHLIADRTFFTLGPVYEAVGVPVDLMEQFAVDNKFGTRSTDAGVENHVFDSVVVDGLTGWANILQSVPTSVAPRLYQWLSSQAFMVGDVEWSLAGVSSQIPDPGDLDPNKTVDVTFVLPRSKTHRVNLEERNPLPPRVYLMKENA